MGTIGGVAGGLDLLLPEKRQGMGHSNGNKVYN